MSVPLLLRKVPRPREHLMPDRPAAPGDVWWELVDPAAPADRPPAAVVLTRPGPDRTTSVLAVTGARPDLVGRLVRELVAALRRTDTTAIAIDAADPAVAAALLAEDLRPLSGPSVLAL